MLSVISTLNTEGVQAGAVYIDTESAFSSERYITIARGVQFDGKVLIAILELWKLQEKSILSISAAKKLLSDVQSL